MKKLISAFALTMLMASGFPVLADEPAPAPAADPAQVIVRLTDGSPQAIASVENTPGITVTDILPDNTIIVAASTTAATAANTLSDLPNVSYAEPNYARGAFTIPTNDTFKDRLWALDNTGQVVNGTTGTSGDDIHAVAAWSLSYGTSTVVAVIDSGVMYTHPDLSANMWDGTSCLDTQGAALGNCVHGYDFADGDLDPLPTFGSTTYAHGTHVAGIIAAQANNGAGTIGVAPSTKIMALRFGFDTVTEVQAIDFARVNGAKIINASYGGTQYSQAEYDAIKRFTDAGGIFVAAAGNSAGNSDTSPIYPAAYDLPGIISVAATDQNDALTSFSNYGVQSVDIGAPGVNIASTYITSTSTPSYVYLDGTSMAAPHVAGAVALIESLYPALSTTTVKTDILAGGDPVVSLASTTVSGKRLNAYKALLLAAGTDLSPPVITLTGASSISLNVGDIYTELGATASDAHDGTTTVTVGGDIVNTSAAGTYHVTYDAVDLAGNHATQVVRTVTVNAVVVSSSGGGGGGGGGGSPSTSYSSGGGGGGSSNRRSSAPVTDPAPRPALAVATTTPQLTIPSVPTIPTTSVAPSFTFVRMLRLGMSGADVTALQSALTHAGVYTGPITRYFGRMTQSAVRAYQAKNGLPQVGTIGPRTRALLNTGV